MSGRSPTISRRPPPIPASATRIGSYGLPQEKALIPVEKLNGPLLLVSGGNDLLWPSTYMAEEIVDRLTAKGHPHPVTHLSYSGAGHAIGRPFRPTTGLSATPNFALGGSPAAYADAERDSWPRVLRFLRESLAARAD